MKTLHIDIMLGERYVFTLHYKYCPIFKLDVQDVYNKVIEKRPSLKGKPFSMCFD